MKHHFTIRSPRSIREGWESITAAFSDPEQWRITAGADYRLTATKLPSCGILFHNSFLPVVQIYATKTTAGMNLDVSCRWAKGVTVMLYTILGLAVTMQLVIIVQMLVGSLHPCVPGFIPIMLGAASYTVSRIGLYLCARKIKELLLFLKKR